MLPFLYAFLIAMAAPQAVQPASDAQSPQATAPAEHPAQVAETPTKAQTGIVNPDDDWRPDGAPKDDYAFVAWCQGALSGHMDLAERVYAGRPVDPLDQDLKKIGTIYLAAYDKALAGADESKTAAGRKRAVAARKLGWKNWDRARKMDQAHAEDAYLAWQVPPRCEHAAVRLSGDKDLFRMAPTPDEIMAKGEHTPVTAGQAARTEAADALAATAPAPPPVSSEDQLKIKTLPDPPAPATDPATEAKKKKDQAVDRAWHGDEGPH